MPGIYSDIESYTNIKYMLTENLQLDVWQCGDHSFDMCRFVLESAARNLKMNFSTEVKTSQTKSFRGEQGIFPFF